MLNRLVLVVVRVVGVDVVLIMGLGAVGFYIVCPKRVPVDILVPFAPKSLIGPLETHYN